MLLSAVFLPVYYSVGPDDSTERTKVCESRTSLLFAYSISKAFLLALSYDG